MALLNSRGEYIKLDSSNNFEIYLTEADRIRVKNATSSETILQKYQEILENLRSATYAEMRYYDRASWSKLFDSWAQEFQDYDNNLAQYIVTGDYPLMAEYFPDVADSIPRIILTGAMGPQLDTVEKAYAAAKQYKTWGETADV